MEEAQLIELLQKDGLFDDFSFRLSPNEAFQEAFLLNLTPQGWNFWNDASCQIGWGDFYEIKQTVSNS